MAKYFCKSPFTYMTAGGIPRVFDPLYNGSPIFDTTNTALAVPGSWVPPPWPDALLPMDSAAQTALQTARAPYAGATWPGLGYVPSGAPPIYNP